MSDLPPAADIAAPALTLPPFPILFGLALQSWPGVCSFLEGMARRNGMKKSARIGLAAALLLGGATFALAQIGPPTGGYPPARLHPNLYYGYYNYYYAPPYYGPFYSLAPHNFPGDYPGAPAYRFWGWCCWSW
jgi:hypothetical protein